MITLQLGVGSNHLLHIKLHSILAGVLVTHRMHLFQLIEANNSGLGFMILESGSFLYFSLRWKWFEEKWKKESVSLALFLVNFYDYAFRQLRIGGIVV